jgi:acyl-CoA thioesterase
MDPDLKAAIVSAAAAEPFAVAMGMELVELEEGRSVVEMTLDPARTDNLYARAHGGAIFALVDEAFETAGQTDGTIAVALNVTISYVSSPETGSRLRASARKVSQTKKTAVYDIRVEETGGRLIALCQAVAFRTGKPVALAAPPEPLPP